MSAVIETFIICDAPRCGKTFGVDQRSKHAYQHRGDAREMGWTRTGNKDFCPECSVRNKSVTN